MTRNLNEFLLINAGTTPRAMATVARLPGRNTWRLGSGDGRNSDDPTPPSARDVANRLQGAGYRVFGWDDEWHFLAESGNRDPVETAAEMVERVGRLCEDMDRPKTAGRIVILMHDNMFRSDRGNRDALADFVQGLKDLGYAFDTLDNY